MSHKKLSELRKKTDTKNIKNYNPTGKPVFVVYACPQCGTTDCSMVPKKLKFRLPFFINCQSCGGWKMYHRAWLTEPYSNPQILEGFLCKDEKIIDMLKPGGGLKEVTDKMDPDGTMWAPGVFNQNDLAKLDAMVKEKESKERMFG